MHTCATINPTHTLTGSSRSSGVLPCTCVRARAHKCATTNPTPTLTGSSRVKVLVCFRARECLPVHTCATINPTPTLTSSSRSSGVLHLPSAANTDRSRGLFCSTSSVASLNKVLVSCRAVHVHTHVCYNKSNTYHLLPTLTRAGDYFVPLQAAPLRCMVRPPFVCPS